MTTKVNSGKVGPWSDYKGTGQPARITLYARVSTLEQAAGHSLDEQVSRLRVLCTERGGRCVRLFREVESGGSIERPKLERMLRLAEEAAFDIVLVWNVDRLGRSNVDLQNIWAFLKTIGVDVVSATEAFDSTTVQGKALFDMLALFSEWERGTIKERAALGALGRAKQGKWHGGPAPHGYRYEPSTDRLHIIKEVADLVRHMAELALEKRDLSAVVRTLRQEGRLTRNGKPWSKPTVSRLLSNPVYVGLLRYRDIVTKDESLRILDDRTFAQLQTLRAEWRRHRIAHYHRPRGSIVSVQEWCFRCGIILTGARAYCSNCGAAQWLPHVPEDDAEPVAAGAASEHPEVDPVC